MGKPSEKSTSIIFQILFTAAWVFLAFIAGVGISVFRIPPYGNLEEALKAIAASYNSTALPTAGISPDRNRTHFLYPIRYMDTGAKIFRSAEIQSGVTLVTSHWKDGEESYPGARLIDRYGNVLHEWRVNLDKIWSESPHTDHAAGSKTRNPYIHGIWLLDNGDVVFNLEYLGLVRMNACSEVVWKLPYRTHHSVFQDSDGNFWVSGLKWVETPATEYWYLKPPFADETLLKVSSDGEILREIDVLKALYEGEYQGLLINNRNVKDITHLNDVEVLSKEMAPAFRSFEAGDLLISLRNINAVFVIDGKTEKIKWHLIHPLIRQHDPDFTPDGTILIYNNRDDSTVDGSLAGQSQILEVEPDTKTVTVKWPTSPEQEFYSGMGGKQQLLDNGNILITEPKAGRIIEISPGGDVVWSWVKKGWDDKWVPEVMEGSRYPRSYATFSTDACQEKRDQGQLKAANDAAGIAM